MRKNIKKKVNTNSAPINSEPKSLFKQKFLSTFFVTFERLPLSEDFLREADDTLSSYEKREIDWQLEKSLRLRNDLLTSFAVSKAENSALTLAEARDVHNLIANESAGKDYVFLQRKLKAGEKLTNKDHDKLEYFNIVRTLKSLNNGGINFKNLSSKLILDLHKNLTLGLDVFSEYLENFEPYHSGHFRNDNKTRVGDFKPAPYEEIEDSVKELVDWIKRDPSATNIFIFHAALYALHPFKNGNKRVCRVLEHFLLQSSGYNQPSLYSISYYYYKHQDRYYKNLIEALYKRNLNYFVSFASEALFFSIIGVVAGVLQRKKISFLENSGLDREVIKILKPLVKRREVKFTRFYALAKRRVARQTFVNYLGLAIESGVLIKREQGKNTYYSLVGKYLEEELLIDWLKRARERLNFLPEEFAGEV